MKCRHNNVILIIGKKKEAKQGSILLPDSCATPADECTVHMVGPDVKGLEPGDVVLRPEVTTVVSRKNPHKDCDFELPDGRKCLVVEDTDIRVVLAPVCQNQVPFSKSD